MKRTNKKGFTIVELVIVIAVIAILAAVLIPTFVSLTKKANESNDTVVAKNMNTALAQYTASNGKPETFDEVLAAIEDHGYVLANLNAKAQGNLYGWDKTNNQIVYINAEGNVIYQNTNFVKEDLQFVVANGNVALPAGYETAKTVDMTKPTGAKALKAALEDGLSVTLTLPEGETELIVDAEVVIPENANVTLNLGGKTYKTTALNEGKTNQTSKYIKVSKGASLTIENGTFEGRGIMNNGGTITVKDGTTIKAVDVNGGGCIRNKTGGTVVIEGGTFEVTNYIKYDDTNLGGAVAIFNEGGNVTINGGTFKSNTDAYIIGQKSGGEITINGGTFEAARGVIAANDGKITVTNEKGNCKFTVTDSHDSAAHVVYSSNGEIIINGGTFEGGDSTFCVQGPTTNTETGKVTTYTGTITVAGALIGQQEDLVINTGKSHKIEG